MLFFWTIYQWTLKTYVSTKLLSSTTVFFPSYTHWVIGVGLDLAALDKHWQKHPSSKNLRLNLLQILLSHNIYMFLKTHTDEDFESCNNFCWNDRSFDRQMASDLGFFEAMNQQKIINTDIMTGMNKQSKINNQFVFKI